MTKSKQNFAVKTKQKLVLNSKESYSIGSIEYQIINLRSDVTLLQQHVKEHRKDYDPVHKLKRITKKIQKFESYLSKKSKKN